MPTLLTVLIPTASVAHVPPAPTIVVPPPPPPVGVALSPTISKTSPAVAPHSV